MLTALSVNLQEKSIARCEGYSLPETGSTRTGSLEWVDVSGTPSSLPVSTLARSRPSRLSGTDSIPGMLVCTVFIQKHFQICFFKT